MKLVLTRKFADCIDGVDVGPFNVGDELTLPVAEARLLIAEGWAVVDRRRSEGAQPTERHRDPPRRRSCDWQRR